MTCRHSGLRLLFRHDWVVYSKRPFGGPEHALRYLGAYTHRVGIANSRLAALSEGNVSFRWRDSAHRNKKRVMSLPVDELPASLPSAPAATRLRAHP
jgi:putative transposase